ncbi:hypothetical protein LFM09_37860 [Lentzea alba]|uniref:hypothetical protein n=1 Tax=Lentzea alba TaxID=2714351 RepID=UPI0039BFBA5E
MKRIFTAIVSAAAAMLALAGPASIDTLLPNTDSVASKEAWRAVQGSDAWDW